MKKKITVIMLLLAMLLTLCACGETDEDAVAVQSVSELSLGGAVGLADRYAGLVVSGESRDVQKDSSKTVLEVLVEEGDIVSEGDVLFRYDTEAMQLQLEKLDLELEELRGKIADAEEQIPVLEGKRKYANANDTLSYNLQIQSLEADIMEATYNISLKEREAASLEASMENADVVSPISGRIMSVNSSDDSSYYYDSGTSDAFITVTDVSTLRVKGTINELNVGTMYEGMSVIVRSRLDSSVIWTGVLDSIDWENTVSSNNNYYYGYSDEMTSTTKYPFYVALGSFDGLILGQHVYIEPDYGQTEVKEGLWISDSFVVSDGDSSYVWADNGSGKLEKRSVTLGDTDSELCMVQILSGLTAADAIAFPEEGLRAGQPCADYAELMFSDDSGFEEEYYAEEYYDGAEIIEGEYASDSEGSVG